MATEEEKLLQDAKKWPWGDRFAHKSWKVRSEAYVDMGSACEGVLEPKDPILKEFGPYFKKAVADSNAPAQEKALDALIAFLTAADADVARYGKEVCDAIAVKCLTGRPKTVEKAVNAFMLWIELEAVDGFLDAMEKAVKHKVAKAVVPAIDAMFQALRDFGSQVVPVKRVVKMLPEVLLHGDQNVRQSAKGLTVEVCRWTGKETVKKLLFDGLREATQKELSEEFDKISGQPRATRLLRSQQHRDPVAAAAETAEVEQESAPETPAAIDAYDLFEPVDVLEALAKTNFWEGIKATKWLERKEAVAELTSISDAPRIAPGDFFEVYRALKKLITDVNIAVATEAIQAAGNLAKGLRRDYGVGSRLLLGTMLDKLKEKKPTVASALKETLQRGYVGGGTTLVDALEDVRVAVKHKVALVRAETLSWLAFCLEHSSKEVVVKVFKEYMPLFVESLQDGTPEVRDAGFSALANTAKKVGMKPVEKQIESLDDVRKKKLAEMVAAASGGGGGGGAPAAAGQAGAAAKPAGQAQAQSSSAPTERVSAASMMSKRGSASTTSDAAAKRPSAAGGGGGAGKKTQSAAVAPVEDTEPEPWTREMLEERAGPVVTPEVLEQLKSAVWKERLEGVSSIKEKLETQESVQENVELLVRLMAEIPGWSDKNVQVLQRAIEVVTLLAEKADKFPRKCVPLCVAGLLEKAADIKTRTQATACLTALAERVGPGMIFERSYPIASGHKNPKVQSETLTWMASAVEDFGVSGVQLKGLLSFCKDTGLASSTPPTRTAAVKVLGVLHACLGPSLKDFLQDVKPALMTSIEAEFAKNPHEGGAAAPKRTVKDAGEGAAAGGGGAGGGSLSETLPRTDISAKLEEAFIEKFSSSNWKVRQECMETVNTIIQEANKRILPNGTGELINALRGRLNDSNKNLIILALSTLANVALAIGPPVDKQSRGTLADILKCLSDTKKQTRESVMKTLDAWLEATSAEKLLKDVGHACMDVKICADGRKDLFEWLLHKDSVLHCAPSELLVLVKPCAAGLQDKAIEVRKAAEAFTNELVRACGADAVAKVAKTELKTEVAAFVPILDRHRAGASSGAVRNDDYSSPGSLRAGSSSGARGTSKVPSPTSKSGSGAKGGLSSARAGTPLSARDAAMMAQPLFNLRESIKEERERHLRGVKAKYEDPRPDQVSELEMEASPIVRSDIARRMFSKDFKLHMEAIEMLQQALPFSPKDFIEVVDLLLRWAVIRIAESNTSCVLKLMDFLPELVTTLKQEGYLLTESEANILLPCLVEKSGHNINNVREKFREVFRLLVFVYPASRVLHAVVDGLRSKNYRTRIECVELMEEMIERHGIEVMGTSRVPLATVAALTLERDTEIRKAALNTLSTAYRIIGEEVWKMLGKLTEAQRGLIEDKFKWKAREMEKHGEGLPGQQQRSRQSRLLGAVGGQGQHGAHAGAGVGGVQLSPVLAGRSPLLGAMPHERARLMAGQSPVLGSMPHQHAAMVGGGASMVAMSPVVGVMGGGVGLPQGMLGGSSYDGQRASDMSMMSMSSSAMVRSSDMSDASTSSSVAPPARPPTSFAEALFFFKKRRSDAEVFEGIRYICELMTAALQSGNMASIEDVCYEVPELLGLLRDQLVRLFYDDTFDDWERRVCKNVLNCILDLFALHRLCALVREEDLRGVLEQLMLFILHARTGVSQLKQDLVRPINVLVLKIITLASPTPVFVSLITMLRPSYSVGGKGRTEDVAQDGVSMAQLITKCLLRLNQSTADFLDRKSLDCDRLLLVIHDFFNDFSPDELRKRSTSDDRSFHMVKKVLTDTIKAKGPAIKAHLSLIPIDAQPPPFVLQHIDMVLQTLEQVRTPGASSDQRDMDELRVILRKLHDRKYGAEGLFDLHRFTQRNPDVDVYEYFNRSSSRISDTFFTYIREGLARVSAHIRVGGTIDTFDMDSPFTHATHAGGGGGAAAAAGAGIGLVSVKSLPLSGLTPNLSSLGAEAAERRSDGTTMRAKSPFKGSMQGIDQTRNRIDLLRERMKGTRPGSGAY